MKCPVCKLPLIVVERQKIELDYCISCSGFWFDTGELNLLSETLGLNLLKELVVYKVDEFSEQIRECPLCDKDMYKVKLGEYSNVLLDKCPEGQGMWFDGGELGRVVNQNNSSAKSSEELINFLGEFLQPGFNG